MATIRRFEEIHAWQKARELVREIYRTCSDGQMAMDFGIRNQVCRAAVSSMSNIAEGFRRKTTKEFAHFLDTARGSVNEVRSLLYVALDVHYLEDEEFERLNRLADETASLIGGLTTYLRQCAELTESGVTKNDPAGQCAPLGARCVAPRPRSVTRGI